MLRTSKIRSAFFVRRGLHAYKCLAVDFNFKQRITVTTAFYMTLENGGWDSCCWRVVCEQTSFHGRSRKHFLTDYQTEDRKVMEWRLFYLSQMMIRWHRVQKQPYGYLWNIMMDDKQKPYMYIGKTYLHHMTADIFSGAGGLILHKKKDKRLDRHKFAVCP